MHLNLSKDMSAKPRDKTTQSESAWCEHQIPITRGSLSEQVQAKKGIDVRLDVRVYSPGYYYMSELASRQMPEHIITVCLYVYTRCFCPKVCLVTTEQHKTTITLKLHPKKQSKRSTCRSSAWDLQPNQDQVSFSPQVRTPSPCLPPKKHELNKCK